MSIDISGYNPSGQERTRRRNRNHKKDDKIPDPNVVAELNGKTKIGEKFNLVIELCASNHGMTVEEFREKALDDDGLCAELSALKRTYNVPQLV